MIRVEDLCKSYGDVRAVDRISFRVERGEVVGFLGPNGAGKSTTMRMLCGCLVPDSGIAEIGGHRVDAEDVEARRRIGYLPESTPLYRSMRVADFLSFVGRARGMRRAERRSALERVLADCDLDGFAERRIGTLSKGYRQRVGLAQALFADPDVLVLDEPTSGLDPAEIVRIRELVQRLGERKTVLLSTHVLGEVQETCRRVVILAGGRIVADGSPLDLAAAEDATITATFRAPADDVRRALEALDEVRSVMVAGRDADGRIGFTIAAADRHAAAEAVAALAAARGWPLSELRHDVPSLETVFLRRTARDGDGVPAAGPFADEPSEGASR